MKRWQRQQTLQVPPLILSAAKPTSISTKPQHSFSVPNRRRCERARERPGSVAPGSCSPFVGPDFGFHLLSLAQLLYAPADSSWEMWLRQRFSSTVAAATLHVIQSLCPDIDTADLAVDIDPGPREDNDIFAGNPPSEVWISELSPGGNGHIEEIQRVYSEDPRRFFTLMTAALRDNDFALADFQLQRFVIEAVDEPVDAPLPTALRRMRAAAGVEETYRAFTDVRHVLAEKGYVTSHAFTVAWRTGSCARIKW